MLGTLLGPHRALARPDDHGSEDLLCLSVAHGGSVLFTLKVQEHGKLNPGQGDEFLVKALANNAGPVLGLAVNAGHTGTLMNLQGTVAGFFSAMQFTHNPKAGTGTRRVVGALQSHAHVTVTEIRCN